MVDLRRKLVFIVEPSLLSIIRAVRFEYVFLNVFQEPIKKGEAVFKEMWKEFSAPVPKEADDVAITGIKVAYFYEMAEELSPADPRCSAAIVPMSYSTVQRPQVQQPRQAQYSNVPPLHVRDLTEDPDFILTDRYQASWDNDKTKAQEDNRDYDKWQLKSGLFFGGLLFAGILFLTLSFSL